MGIDENGGIVINEKSLLLHKKVDDSELKKSEVLVEDAHSFSATLRKTGGGKRWSIPDTLRFYRALSNVGTDFTLMQKLFPKHTRKELKQKFKREEKINGDLIDSALSCRLPLDMDLFLPKDDEEEIETAPS